MRKAETSEDRREKEKLKKDAEKNMAAAKADKNDVQKVRQLLNLITMANYDSMKQRLREMIFGDRLTFN
jgi:hypothetical protein